MAKLVLKKFSRAILGYAVGKSWETGTPAEKWPGIEKFVRIYRHLRRGSQTPAGGPPPPVQPSVRKVRLPLSLSPSRSARPGHSAAESFAPRLPFGPAPSTREGKAKVHSLHLRAQALRQAANDQRALEPSSWEADGEKGGDSLLRPPLREGSWRARTQGAASRGPDACPMSIKALARLTRLP
jgi:hypothetical protein